MGDNQPTIKFVCVRELVAKAIGNVKKLAKQGAREFPGLKRKAEQALEKAAITDINFAEEGTGHTLLHRAAAFGALKVIRMLHARGAALDVINAKKQTALDVAEHIGETKAAALLRALAAGKSGDDLNASDGSDGEDSS